MAEQRIRATRNATRTRTGPNTVELTTGRLTQGRSSTTVNSAITCQLEIRSPRLASFVAASQCFLRLLVLEFDLLLRPHLQHGERSAHHVFPEFEYGGLFNPCGVFVRNRQIVVSLFREERERGNQNGDGHPTSRLLSILKRLNGRIGDL